MSCALRRSLARTATLVLFVASLGVAHSVSAHPTPGSVAFVDFTVEGARIEQDVPLEELERALHRRLVEPDETPEQTVHRQRELLRAYAARHLRVVSEGGSVPWQVRVLEVTGHAADDGPRARFRFALLATKGEASGSVRLVDDIVAHEVVSHYLTVYVRSDWAAGTEGPPRLVGVVHAGRNDLAIARRGSFWRGFQGIVRLGCQHIASGTDHLLFLFALVLVAPVAALHGRWRARRDLRGTLLSLAGVVSAFTAGHSATLALGSFGWVRLPSTAVEAAIAASILISAIHVVRPVFPGREALVAGAFGLVHGLAFADTLIDRDLGHAQTAWTLLGFNLGIELAQLALLALTIPWLLVLARTRAYDGFRAAWGSVAALLALGWLLERSLGIANPLAVPLSWLEGHAMLVLVALATGTLIARAVEARACQRESRQDAAEPLRAEVEKA